MFRNRINDYFAHCVKTAEVPTKTGMFQHMGIYLNMWTRYKNEEGYKPICDWVDDTINTWYKNDLYRTTVSNTNKQLVAKIENSWKEQGQDVTVTHKIDIGEAKAKLMALLEPLLKARELQGEMNTPVIDVTPEPVELQLTEKAQARILEFSR
jgi:hypothetical protein